MCMLAVFECLIPHDQPASHISCRHQLGWKVGIKPPGLALLEASLELSCAPGSPLYMNRFNVMKRVQLSVFPLG